MAVAIERSANSLRHSAKTEIPLKQSFKGILDFFAFAVR